MNKFDEIMLKKHTDSLVKARDKQDNVQIEASLKKIERIVKTMDKQERAEFDTQYHDLSIQLDQFNESASMLSDGLSTFDHTNPDEVDKLMQDEITRFYRSMPNAPTHDPRGPLPAKLSTSQATLNRLNSEKLQVPTGPLKNASPKKTTQPRQTQPAKLHQVSKNTTQEKPAEPTKPTVSTKPAAPIKKSNSFDQYLEKKHQELTKRRKESMVDAKNDLKKAYQAICNLLTKIIKAISKAPEQEKKLSAQDKRVIEQSADQLIKPTITPEQAIVTTENILHQLENPSQPDTVADKTHAIVTSEPGWLSQTLDVVKSTLTRLSHTLGFKSAKEELQQTIKNLENQPNNSKAKDNKQEPGPEPEPETPRSGP